MNILFLILLFKTKIQPFLSLFITHELFLFLFSCILVYVISTYFTKGNINTHFGAWCLRGVIFKTKIQPLYYFFISLSYLLFDRCNLFIWHKRYIFTYLIVFHFDFHKNKIKPTISIQKNQNSTSIYYFYPYILFLSLYTIFIPIYMMIYIF